MAGEIARYTSPSIAFEVKPARSIQYHDKLMSSKNTSKVMEDYLLNEIDENVLLGLLQSEDNKSKALQYLDQHLQENNGILIFRNKQDLFKGFALALGDPNQKLNTHCTKIVSKIIPQLGGDLDKQMVKILPLIIANVGNPSVTLQKESIQALHVYMKQSLDVFQILDAIAHHGILHSNARIRQQIIRSFPTLLFAEFKHEDFFDVVHSLAVNLTETLVDQDITLSILEKVSDFIGKDTFNTYLNKLSAPLRHTFNRLQASRDVNKLIDAKAPNRIEIHSKHAEVEKDSIKYTSALLDRDVSDKRVNSFSKSSHFNTAPRRRQHGNMYTSLSVLPNYDTNSLVDNSNFGNESSRYKELSFIPKYVIEQLSNSDHSVRLQAVETLKEILSNLGDPFVIKENMVPLLSLLQPMFDDKNFRVACVALKAFSVMISYIGPNLDSCLKLFVYAVSRKLGNVKDSVRSECYKVLLQVMEMVGCQKVLNLFWDKLSHKQYKVREDFTCIIIATLLNSLKTQNKQNDLDYDDICSHVAPLLTDSQQVVRKAALDCIAVLGHILGTTSKQLLSAVDSVELKHDNASGVMPAVHARLLRRQLPRLTENMLVEYAVFPTATASLTSPQGADIHWILAAEKPKKTSGTPKSFYGSQEREHRQDYKRLDEVLPDSSSQPQTRRHMSAGKHRQFPWAMPDDPANSKHPSSAPVSGVKAVVKKQPPFRPRNTWGPESEITQFPSAPAGFTSKTKSGYEPSLDAGPSYQELYRRKKNIKEANLNKPSVSSAHSSKTDSGYKPSFGSNDFSASSSSTVSSSMLSSSLALSNSCPSAFFENSTTPRPNLRRIQKKMQQSDEIASSSAYGSEESTSPFSSMKPALARSASKRRDNAVSISRDLLKTDDHSEKIPVKLKTNASASPRFDRLVSNNSVDQMRPMLKAHQNSSTSSYNEKFPGPTSNSDVDLASEDSGLPSGYTPSPLRRKFKESMKNEQNYKSSSTFDKDRAIGSDLPSKQTVEATVSKPTARPIVPSNYSPARHRNYEDVSEFQSNAVSSIRRSAQNKRERMQSQPTSEDSFNGSFNEFSGHPLAKASSSSLLDSENTSNPATETVSQQPVSNETTPTSAVSTETPSLKFSPNTGRTFVSKAETDVSVVGIRYPNQVYSGMLPSSNTETRTSPSSPASTASTSNFNNVATTGSNKYLSNQSGHDRLRSHRGSALGMASSTASPDSASASFNIQGKGVFMTTSSTSLVSGSDINDVSSSSSKEELSITKSSSNETRDSTKLLDGVCGVAVRQPSLTPEDLSPQTRRVSDLGLKVSISASLRESKKKQKEVLTKKVHSTPKGKYYDSTSVSLSDNLDTVYDSRSKLNKTTPLRVNGSSNRPMYDRDSGIGSLSSKSGAGTPTTALLPLDNPERSLADAVSSLGVADSSDWEVVTQGMYTIRRLVTYHPNTLSTRFHDVIVLLTKHVSSLRSQVSKASVQAIHDLYTYLKKPLLDSDIDTTVRALLFEHGKPNSFIRNETNKAMQAIIASATSSKILNALLSAGLRHKNKDVQGTTAKFCAELVDKMGPGKALSGVKDTTDKLLEAVAVFVTNRSQEVRYYGRYIINELMVHEDFGRCLDRHLSAESAQEVKAAASSIKDRGLGSLSSVGSRKALRKRNGTSASSSTASTSAEKMTPSTTTTTSSAYSRRKGAGGKIFNEQEQEELKSLCDDLSAGNLNERKSAIMLLFNKLHQDRRFVEDNIVKIMGAYVSLLSTAQTKINFIGLESLPDLIVELHPCLRDIAHQLVPALLKLVSSKPHCELALKNIDFMVNYIEHTWIIQPFATSAMYGTPKTKQIAITTLSKLLDRVARKKLQIIDQHVLPVLWNLFSSNSGVQLRKETMQLTEALYKVYGQKLFEYAEAKNHLAKVKDILNPAAQ